MSFNMRIFEITEAIGGTGTLGKNLDSRSNKVAMKYVNKLIDIMEEDGHPVGSRNWEMYYPGEWDRIRNKKRIVKLIDDAMTDFENEYKSIALDYMESQSLKTRLEVQLKRFTNQPFGGLFHSRMFDNWRDEEWDEYGDTIPGIEIYVNREKLWWDFLRGARFMSEDVHRPKIYFHYINYMNSSFLHEMIHLVQHVRSRDRDKELVKWKTYIPDYRDSKNRKRKGRRGYSGKIYNRDSIEYLAYVASEPEVEAWAAMVAYDMVYGIGDVTNIETIRAAMQSVKTNPEIIRAAIQSLKTGDFRGSFSHSRTYDDIRKVVNSALRSPNPTPKEKQYIKFWNRARKKIIQHLLTFLEQKND